MKRTTTLLATLLLMLPSLSRADEVSVRPKGAGDLSRHAEASEAAPNPGGFYTPEQDKAGMTGVAPVDQALPKVLILGDSISIGYTVAVRNGLKGRANVTRPRANCGDTPIGLKNLSDWLGTGHWDVIHFNWGLWDLCYRHPESKTQGRRDKVKGKLSVPPDEYERNLEELVRRLQATGAKLIWASTTVVPEGEAGRFVGDDVKYNAIAARVMRRHGIPTNDLHALSKSFAGRFSTGAGDVHYTPEGSARLAAQVVAAIAAVLKDAPIKAHVSGQAVAGGFPLVRSGTAADILVSAGDWKVARIAANDLTLDVERVTGKKPRLKDSAKGLSAQAVLVGTIGKSPVIDGLIQAGKLKVDGIRNQWESFLIEVVENPLPGVKQGLVIAGSDRRGTAYGVYELSRRIGVSPWYWWADVTPVRRAELHVSPERVQVGPPAVKYRGIFINDEMWGIRPWAHGTLAPDEGKGLGPTTYRKIFELLLRLRANYLWPAMHLDTIPFNCYPENKTVADDYAIVMGSSHIEPMLRNNMAGAEWDREGGGDWNYLTNRDGIYEYWEKAIRSNGRFENIYTIGMRGRDDEAMKGGDTAQEKISLLERIFDDQREILARHIDPDPARVPQVFIPYTEVLGLYDAGMEVPDDVTICWPDDNFGYIRRLPTAKERARPGGSGVYYHIQWINGATTAYPWLNTMPPALIWTEMHKAWEYEARKLWVLNVGDIKPGEIGIELFMDMAWNPDRWRHDTIGDFLKQWAARDLDPRFAGEIAGIMEEYYRLGFTRRPEHLVQYRHNVPLKYSWFSHDQFGDEAGRRLASYESIATRAENIYKQLPDERKDAFFELVLYPVKAAYLMNLKVISADRSMRRAAEGRASAGEHAARAREAAAGIISLTDHYNTGLIKAGDKWRYMMTWSAGPWGSQRHQFEMPPLSDYDGVGPPALGIGPEGGKKDRLAGLSVFLQDRRFIDLYNMGKGEIRWTASTAQSWIKLSKPSGSFTTEERIQVSIDWARAPIGERVEGEIRFESNGGGARVLVPVFKPASPSPDEIAGFVESHGYVSMEAEHFTRKESRGGAAWEVVKGLGRSGDSVAVFPPTVASRTEPAEILSASPSLQYDLYLFHSGDARLDIDCLPTKPVGPGRGVRLAVGIDDQEPRILAGDGGDVITNLRRITAPMKIDAPGKHVLKIWMVDPGVVVDKIVLDFGEPRDSYLGPPESRPDRARAAGPDNR